MRMTINHVRNSEELAILGVSNLAEPRLSMTSLGDEDQQGLSYRLYSREGCATICAEGNFWTIRRSQVVQGDLLVAYPVDRHSCYLLGCHVNFQL